MRISFIGIEKYLSQVIIRYTDSKYANMKLNFLISSQVDQGASQSIAHRLGVGVVGDLGVKVLTAGLNSFALGLRVDFLRVRATPGETAAGLSRSEPLSVCCCCVCCCVETDCGGNSSLYTVNVLGAFYIK